MTLMNRSSYCLLYDKPAPNTYKGWEEEALPLGNGHLGAKVFGLIGEERIQINEKSLWSGGPGAGDLPYLGGNDREVSKKLFEIRDLLENGKIKQAQRLAETYLIGPKDERYGRFLSFCDLYLTFFKQRKCLQEVKDYQRSLDLERAISRVDYQLGESLYTRECFLSYPDNVLVLWLQTSGKADLEFSLDLKLTEDLMAAGCYLAEKSQMKSAKNDCGKLRSLFRGRSL